MKKLSLRKLLKLAQENLHCWNNIYLGNSNGDTLTFWFDRDFFQEIINITYRSKMRGVKEMQEHLEAPWSVDVCKTFGLNPKNINWFIDEATFRDLDYIERELQEVRDNLLNGKFKKETKP